MNSFLYGKGVGYSALPEWEYEKGSGEMEQLTVRELIDKLYQFSSDEILYTSSGVILDGEYGSYRGYYEDVSFGYKEDADWEDPSLTVGEFLSSALNAKGSTLHGYKGGSFYCGDDTVCWLSNYSESTGLQIVDVVEVNYKVTLITVYDHDKYRF